jgi:hypothetical protein
MSLFALSKTASPFLPRAKTVDLNSPTINRFLPSAPLPPRPYKRCLCLAHLPPLLKLSPLFITAWPNVAATPLISTISDLRPPYPLSLYTRGEGLHIVPPYTLNSGEVRRRNSTMDHGPTSNLGVHGEMNLVHGISFTKTIPKI